MAAVNQIRKKLNFHKRRKLLKNRNKEMVTMKNQLQVERRSKHHQIRSLSNQKAKYLELKGDANQNQTQR
jgi:hypothetical protein